MDVLNESGVLIFQETAPGAWVWLLLLLPGILIIGVCYSLIPPLLRPAAENSNQSRAGELAFAVGMLLLAVMFLPLPWIVQHTYTGLRFEFDEAAGLVRVRDARSPDVYATPFTGFRGLVLGQETRSGDNGDNETTYEIYLARVTGPTYSIFRGKDRERALELANRLSHMLRLTVVTDFNATLALMRDAPNTAARIPMNAEGQASFSALHRRDATGAEECTLEYAVRVSPLAWAGVLFGLVAAYWLAYLTYYRGLTWRIGLGYVAALISLGAVGSHVIKNFAATGVVSFVRNAAGVGEVRAWTEPALWSGRVGETSLPFNEVRVVQAQISTQDSAFYLYDRNPFAIRGLGDVFDTARNLKTIELNLAAVPVVDRLRLADILAAGLAW